EVFNGGFRNACVRFASLADAFSSLKNDKIMNAKRSIALSEVIIMIKKIENDYCNESNMVTYLRLGESYLTLGQYSDAEKHLEKAFKIAQEVLPDDKVIIDYIKDKLNRASSKTHKPLKAN
ncbi:tetratricopeptide repeat protein, partial [Candidatus Saccharibacteria bacterium]|nr:tetratricopeptide repeat protein [Candidatus Saccharibacteria bacterium]